MSAILRPEARPHKRLTYFQLEAARRLVGTLEAAVRELPAPRTTSASRTSRPIDVNRASRLFFLSGEPGTGKTSLYLSLRAALEGQETELSRPAKGTSENKIALDELRRRLDKLRQSIVWLAPLDLEVAATATTNYLAAVITRIDRVIADVTRSHSGSQEPRGLLEHSSTYSDALLDFQRLKTDIGLAWDGNQPRRAETMDPDAFAEEVLRAEDARLCINDRLNGVLERLIPDLYRSNPMLVLPVDDLYLNPNTSLEFLRLMRMISNPRLFILAMGEFRVIEELFFQKTLGELIDLAGDSAYRIDSRQSRVLAARARRLTYHSFRKLLPPAQRYEMPVLYWNETLDFRLSLLSEEGIPGTPWGDRPLGHLLELFPLSLEYWPGPAVTPKVGEEAKDDAEESSRFLTWMDFLRLPGKPEIREKYTGVLEEVGLETAQDASGYTGLQALELPVRNALDLWLEIEQAFPTTSHSELEVSKLTWEKLWETQGKKEKPWEICRKAQRPLLSLVVHQALQALNEQDYLTNEEREQFEEAIRGTQYISQTLDTSLLRVEAKANLAFAVELPERDKKLSFNSHRRWHMLAADLKDKNPLPPRPTAWFVLFHDLLVLLENEGLDGTPLTPEKSKMPWVEITLEGDDKKEGDDKSRAEYWSLPEWPSFWQFDIFLCAWNHVLAKEKNSSHDDKKKLETLAFHWVDLAARVILHDFPNEAFFKSKELPGADWSKFEERIPKLSEFMKSKANGSNQVEGPSAGQVKHVKDWLRALEKMKGQVPSLTLKKVQNLIRVGKPKAGKKKSDNDGGAKS